MIILLIFLTRPGILFIIVYPVFQELNTNGCEQTPDNLIAEQANVITLYSMSRISGAVFLF
jgi:hypothetical protein